MDINSTVYDICKAHPQAVTVLKALGFENITNPLMMKTAGKVMTLPKASAMKGIPMEKIEEAMEAAGIPLERSRKNAG